MASNMTNGTAARTYESTYPSGVTYIPEELEAAAQHAMAHTDADCLLITLRPVVNGQATQDGVVRIYYERQGPGSPWFIANRDELVRTGYLPRN